MKNLKKALLIVVALIVSVVLISCKKTEYKPHILQDIVLYKNEERIKDGLKIKNNYSYEVKNNILILSFSIEFENVGNNIPLVELNNAKAYGNDYILTEEVLVNYDKSKEIVKFNSYNTKIKDKEKYLLNLVIRDGNPLCRYELDIKLNDVTLALFSHEYGYKTKFLYIHNPEYSPETLADAVYDEAAYFGYKPSETGSLKQYTSYDWTNEDDVLSYKQERIKYITENDEKLKELEKKLRAEGKSVEEIAKACSNLRNQIRLDQYKDDPEGLAKLKARNLEKYGHEEGPLPEELYVKYNNSWEMVLKKSYNTNRGMDACCGVYDTYYYLYNDLAY